MASSSLVSRGRWWLAVVLGTLAFALAVAGSFILPQVLLGLRLEGVGYAVVGVLQLALALVLLSLALKLARLRWRDVGLVREGLAGDVLVGLSVAAGFALLQFGIIIPATGGAARSDVATNLQQLAGPGGLLGMAVLAPLGAIAEELYFRGVLLLGLRGGLGGRLAGTVVAVLVVVVVFGALHGYQGWAGVVDTALYGGLALSLLCLLRGRRLAAPIVAHAGWNLIALVAMTLLY